MEEVKPITLTNILSAWLEKPKGGKRFFVEYAPASYDIIRCKRCTCFTAFVDKQRQVLQLRRDPVGYDRLEALDQQFLPKLEAHLKAHICS